VPLVGTQSIVLGSQSDILRATTRDCPYRIVKKSHRGTEVSSVAYLSDLLLTEKLWYSQSRISGILKHTPKLSSMERRTNGCSMLDVRI